MNEIVLRDNPNIQFKRIIGILCIINSLCMFIPFTSVSIIIIITYVIVIGIFTLNYIVKIDKKEEPNSIKLYRELYSLNMIFALGFGIILNGLFLFLSSFYPFLFVSAIIIMLLGIYIYSIGNKLNTKNKLLILPKDLDPTDFGLIENELISKGITVTKYTNDTNNLSLLINMDDLTIRLILIDDPKSFIKIEIINNTTNSFPQNNVEQLISLIHRASVKPLIRPETVCD